MKSICKTCIFLLFLFVAAHLSAQSAKKSTVKSSGDRVVSTMTPVLGLTKIQQDSLTRLNAKYQKKQDKLRQAHKDTKSREFRNEYTFLKGQQESETKNYLGSEKWDAWQKYRDEERKKVLEQRKNGKPRS